MYVPPEANLKPRLSWKVFKNGKTGTWHIFGMWGIHEWRRSSPVLSVTEDESTYYAKTLSGSSYILDKDDEQENSTLRMENVMQSINEENKDGALR